MLISPDLVEDAVGLIERCRVGVCGEDNLTDRGGHEGFIRSNACHKYPAENEHGIGKVIKVPCFGGI